MEKPAGARLVGKERVFFGMVSGDEPNAVLVAEDVLKAGGTAADAATAMLMTLPITMPSSAGLGSSGMCLVHNPDEAATIALNFIANATSKTEGAIAVPALLRGIAALHARYGQIDLRALIAKAEQKARFGHLLSRASASELALAAGPLFADPAAKKIFSRRGGQPLGEGETLTQLDLAEVLASVRTRGIRDFYEGTLAAEFVAAANSAGASLTLEDLKNFRPQWQRTIAIPYRDLMVHFAPLPADGAATGSQMWHMLAEGNALRSTNNADELHLLAETAKRAFAERGSWLSGPAEKPRQLANPQRAVELMSGFSQRRATDPATIRPAPELTRENPVATSFVIVDLVGQSVSCALTMNNFFGTGRIATGTGVFLAAPPGQNGQTVNSLALMLATNRDNRAFRYASAASGGAAAVTSMVRVASSTLLQEQILEKSIAAPRIHHSGAPDLTLVEQGVDPGIIDSLRQRGHNIETIAKLGRVNAVECPLGLGTSIEDIACFSFADKRGLGLSVEAER